MHNVQCIMQNYPTNAPAERALHIHVKIRRMNERSSLHVLLFSCLKIMNYALCYRLWRFALQRIMHYALSIKQR